MNAARSPSLRRLTIGLGLILGLSLATACATRPPENPEEAAAAEAIRVLVDVAAIPGDFMARQRLLGAMGEHRLAADVVLQKQGDTLTLMGLTPFGTRAFALIQDGREVSFQPFIDAPLPFPPELMLADIHRTLFLGIGAPAADGSRRLHLAGERVDERWAGGRLMERRFLRRRGKPKGLIAIDYGEGMRGSEPPPKVEIRNERFGYTVTIETVTFQRLDTPRG
ncbi:MAG: DUF3261 domain-containing protein [Myxococcales bacterium]|nr:DUF3261 domain-containing protein [Myxococcales bacterium]